MTEHTPSQTVGPFLHIALADPAARFAAPAGGADTIVLTGVVTDGAGAVVPDGLVESWQATRQAGGLQAGGQAGGLQAGGRFGRCATDAEGRYEIHTVKPASVTTRDGTAQAPHLSLSVFARGLFDRVITRAYFGDEAANDDDPTLAAVDPARRHLLIAQPDPHTPGRYHLDIRLQGDDEAVFFDL